MFDVGMSEMLIVAAIALVAIGPKQLPEVARVVGKFLGDIKKAGGELTKDFVAARDDAERSFQELRETVRNQIEPSVQETRDAADRAISEAHALLNSPVEPVLPDPPAPPNSQGRGES
jgi:sec-independent protein translocase protein TatB